MRLAIVGLAVAACATGCLAQNWEFGGGIGYGWTLNSGLSNVQNGADVGHEARGAFTFVFDENPYNYIGGELEYLFRAGGTQLHSGGITETASGYSNLILYSLMVHMKSRESNLRPFLAVGSGIKVYTNSAPLMQQPLSSIAVLTQGTQVEPTLSFAAGVKFLLPHHLQLRLDTRVFTGPTPNQVVRPVYPSRTKGWIFDFIPMLSVAYVF